ncbi:branched-chain amino acid transport system II carrier protein [Schinkia sp. CFF1]
MSSRKSFSFIITVGFMLFALFFGAGNLIFPVMLGQLAGENVWAANAGFIVTGVGLPVLGVLALGFSGKSDLQSLASRVHPIYGTFFTCALYLSIGPLFAIPRTATVSYEIGIKPFLGENAGFLPLLIFSIIFFVVTLFFSLKSSKLVDVVGKVLTPILLLSIAVLIVAVFLTPMGEIQAPTEHYLNNAFFKGFQEGYLTMDALAAFVFGIIIINTMKNSGAVTKKEIMTSSLKVALIAGGLLAAIYSSLAYLGATSVSEIGRLDNGGAVLAAVSAHYFGSYGNALLSIIVIAACLTTSIGLITSCAAYFNKLVPGISYTKWAIIFTIFSTIIANFGLSTLISISVPVLVTLYPLAICLLVLTFLHPLFKGKKEVYQISILLTGIVSIFDGLNAAGIKIQVINDLFTTILPMYSVGLGWILPAIVGGLIGFIINVVKKADYQVSPVENN